MNLSRRNLALALDLCPGLGGILIARTLARLDLLGIPPIEMLSTTPESLREDYHWASSAIEAWTERKQSFVDRAEEHSLKLDQHGVSILTAADAAYPDQVETIDPKAPGLLYLYGNARLMNTETFTVMSSRQSSPAALDLIERLTEESVLQGRTLVSGHNTPEYRRAAIVPLRWGSPRILALDVGFFHALGNDLKEEPFRAARLWRYQFDPHTDLVVSSVNPFEEGHKGSNAARDRLIATLSLRLNFVEIRESGNMDKLARLALKAKRSVRVSDLSLDYKTYRKLGAEIIPA